MQSCEFAMTITALACNLAQGKTPDEIALYAAFFSQLGDTLATHCRSPGILCSQGLRIPNRRCFRVNLENTPDCRKWKPPYPTAPAYFFCSLSHDSAYALYSIGACLKPFAACSVSFFMANSFLFLKLGKPFLHLRHHLGIFLQL